MSRLLWTERSKAEVPYPLTHILAANIGPAVASPKRTRIARFIEPFIFRVYLGLGLQTDSSNGGPKYRSAFGQP